MSTAIARQRSVGMEFISQDADSACTMSTFSIRPFQNHQDYQDVQVCVQSLIHAFEHDGIPNSGVEGMPDPSQEYTSLQPELRSKMQLKWRPCSFSQDDLAPVAHPFSTASSCIGSLRDLMSDDPKPDIVICCTTPSEVYEEGGSRLWTNKDLKDLCNVRFTQLDVVDNGGYVCYSEPEIIRHSLLKRRKNEVINEN
jgi:hypothetical protein